MEPTISTDSIKTLAKRHGITPDAIREMAEDLNLNVEYSASRRTWFIAEDARTVRMFNDHLTYFRA
jgi:SOS-response transcriptional repressor LexA